MSCGIYKLSSTIDNRFYIGSSKNIEGRIYSHFNDLKHGEHENEILQRFYTKYGPSSLIHTIVEECSEEMLIERENFYICSSSSDLLFNMKLIVDERPVHSEERRQMMSEKKRKYFSSEESKITREKLSLKTKERYAKMTQEERSKSLLHTRTSEVQKKREESYRRYMENSTEEQKRLRVEQSKRAGRISGEKKKQKKRDLESKIL